MTGQTSALQALMHLLKAYIGTGILAMPKTFSYSGVVIGVIGTPFLGFLCHICIHQLVELNEYFLSTKVYSQPMDFEDLAETVFMEGPKPIRRFAKLSRFVVMFFLFIAQMGFCCAYYLFVANNIREFFVNLEVGSAASINLRMYLVIILPFIIAISFVKSIRHLSNASMVANIIQLVSFAIIIYNLVFDIGESAKSFGDRTIFGTKIPQFFSTTMFTYEGITVSMALYRSMKNRHDFAKTFGVINFAIIIVMILYTLVGLLGYLKYGDDVAASITLSLPNEKLYTSIQLMYSLAISVSYGVQLYVAIHLIWPFLHGKLEYHGFRQFYIEIVDYSMRIILVLLTFALAILIPELDLILSLMGAISCSTVAIMIPPVLHAITFYRMKTDTFSKTWLIVKDGFIFLVGFCGFIIGTYYGLSDIITQDHLA